MEWTVIYHPKFAEWLESVEQKDSGLYEEILANLRKLAEFGPSLGRPSVDTLKASRIANLKELRVQYQGEPFRLFFVFDRQRRAVMLVAGSKKGENEKRWYKEKIRTAEQRYAEHLKKMEKEEDEDDDENDEQSENE